MGVKLGLFTLREEHRLRVRPVKGSCEHGNEPSGFIKCWEVLE
jgi:hypothetical protein